MVGHQAQRMHLPAGFPAGFPQGFHKQLPVFVRSEDRLAPVPAVHYLINRSRIFNAKFSGHFPKYSDTPQRPST
jgi:hypothetical protein